MDYSREIDDALSKDPLPIDPRYYGKYADVTGRMGAKWLEEKVMEYEADHAHD